MRSAAKAQNVVQNRTVCLQFEQIQRFDRFIQRHVEQKTGIVLSQSGCLKRVVPACRRIPFPIRPGIRQIDPPPQIVEQPTGRLAVLLCHTRVQ